MKHIHALCVGREAEHYGFLQHKNPYMKIDHVESLAECGPAKSLKNRYDMVLLALGKGEEATRTLKDYAALDLSIPAIICLNSYDEGVVTEAFTCGIQDYLIQDRTTQENFFRIVEYAITRHKLLTRLAEKVGQLEEKSREVLEKSMILCQFLKDLEKPVKTALHEGHALQNASSLLPDQKGQLHKVVASLSVIHAIMEEVMEASAEFRTQDSEPRKVSSF